MAKIFISYASEDKEIVEQIYNSLANEGITIWMDKKNLVPGQNWRIEIEKAISFSDIFLACLSNNSVDKQGYVQKELKTALDFADQKPEGAIFIIPIRLDECEVPYRLKEIQWINYREKNSIEKLVSAINYAPGIEKLEVPEKKVPSQKQAASDSEYSKFIKQDIESITFNSALLCERIDPQIATRKMQAQLRDIYDRLLHYDDEDIFNTVELAKKRVVEFNKVTGWEFTENDIKLIDFFLGNPDQIPVWLVFEQMYKDGFQKEWEIYKSCFEGKQYVEFKKEGEDVYKQINEWLQNKAEHIYKVAKKNFPDVSPKMYSLKPIEL